ncbi:MAG: prolyl-tRNA synthetase [archaeon GW2011_AR17]|nr:MAG: prolyl-tRNA synthetase [archaeon GW2011_AR17]MBS3153865.1 prolyl-tRNA synthetase associated domain-containing protein [Candidatus Woesearchaeota archaeon]HIH15466.1 prolyl-tRNA synthetase associated domain-containing protein [Nanoarchaeota archaeon]HIH59269.1 prolyl-tRNA synthetase associated domain-containing protein [Nanoarchaeota archaeon]HII13936.1 prolyl-tRNA synthetase associated domain-containing protein [Nanoarchaeota archaeon]
MEQYIKQFLDNNNISYILHTHPAVFSCEEADIHCKHVPGTPGKNLFLKEEKGNQFFLVILSAHKKLNMNSLAPVLNVKKLKFANENELKEILGLTPGSVSPLGLLNDKEKKTRVIIDEEIWAAETVNFHPNINTESLEFTKDNFHRLITTLSSNFKILEI